MNESGSVLVVVGHDLGSALIEDAPLGAETLTVADTADFSEDGGRLQIAEDAVLTYDTIEDDDGVIYLSEPLTAAYEEGEPVKVWDASQGAAPIVYVAHVVLDGDDQNEDAVEATIPHNLIAYLPEGFRVGPGEVVTVGYDEDDELMVLDVHLRAPALDGGYVSPDTITGVQIAPLSITHMELEDFTIPVTKFRSQAHHIY